MTEPKLLTEAEWRNVFAYNADIAITYIRERGLVADDPVDPDLLEAREIATDHAAKFGHDYVRYPDDDAAVVQIAFAALKRGKELRPTLTREMVAASLRSLFVNSDGVSYATDAMLEEATSRVHTALVEQMK